METLAKVAGKPGNSGKCPENSRTACREEPGNPGNPLYKRGSLPASRIPLLGVKKESFFFHALFKSSARGKVFKQKERQMKNSAAQRRACGRRRAIRPTPIDAHVGIRIRDRRLEAGISQPVLGEA